MELESIHIREVAGIKMILAIDSTLRGPALGGCRWKLYPNEPAARRDARDLAGAMTRKAALAGLNLGGGKAVVIGDPRARTREQLLALGDFVESLQGRYITAADMGTGEEEMAVISERTRHVSGLPRRMGGSGGPGAFTAVGVHLALEASLAEVGRPMEGARVAIQGVGNVGAVLIERLLAVGASIVAADPRPKALEDLPSAVEVVSPAEIVRLECDVFSPCGPPAVIDDVRAAELRCRIVCGAANNPLSEPRVAARLAERGILFIPDFLANAGGLIHLAVALEGGDHADSMERLQVIPRNLARVVSLAREKSLTTAAAAEELALRALTASGDA